MMKQQLKLGSQRILAALGLGLTLTLALLWMMAGIAYAAGFTVTKTTDTFDGTCDADCSLRDALFAANGNAVDDTITLLAGTYVLTIPGTSEDVAADGDLDINDVTGNLSLVGNGAIIDGANINESIFQVHAGNVTISDLTVQNGSGSIGGGIYNVNSVLTLTNVSVLSNTAPQGGGIYNGASANARLTLINSLVANNTAGDIFGWGGGILNINDATLTLISSTIRNNRANFGGNSFVGGGGLANAGTATLVNSLISQNVISTTSGQPGGGGIDNHGVLTLTNTTVRDNLSNQDGGGIWNLGPLAMVNSTLSGNRTQTGHGGGIANITLTPNSISLSGSTFTNNTAANLGGAFYNQGPTVTLTITGSTFISNAAVFGGALYNSFSSGDNFKVTINNSAFIRNRADNSGGAISEAAANTDYRITGSAFISNTTVTDQGGAFSHFSMDGRLSITNTTLSGNSAATYGGGIFLINADTFLNNVTIANNTAALDGGGLIRGSVVGTYTLANTIVAGNVAPSGPDISGTVVSAGYNLIQNPAGAIINGVTTGNITNTNPNLGPLAGAIPYHPLLEDSPAIDAGNNVNPVGGAFPACAAIDQRGQTRPIDGDEDGTARCDIGAYEFTTAATSLYLPIVLKNN